MAAWLKSKCKKLPFQEMIGHKDTGIRKSGDLGRPEIGMHCLQHIVYLKKKKRLLE